jgi:hypothetical protein
MDLEIITLNEISSPTKTSVIGFLSLEEAGVGVKKNEVMKIKGGLLWRWKGKGNGGGRKERVINRVNITKYIICMYIMK